ncbi:FCD domain-containing protein, partial [Roseovarius sp. S4756]|uniref:FCD domain-containing protein n=1 Tax=Roseovarius maritimus TaxID=3342637 RepID=UPI003B6704F4
LLADVDRTDPAALADLQLFLAQSELAYSPGTSPVELVRLDEEFHRRIAQLANNAELLRLLDNAAARIRYVRVIDLQSLSEINGAAAITTQPHVRILAAIAARNEDWAGAEMRAHISRRLEEVTHNVRMAFSQIYAP